MKNNLIIFIKNFEENLSKELASVRLDNADYMNYVVGEENACMELRSIISDIDEENIKEYIEEKIKRIENIDYTQLSKLETTYFNGMKNMCIYVLREVNR